MKRLEHLGSPLEEILELAREPGKLCLEQGNNAGLVLGTRAALTLVGHERQPAEASVGCCEVGLDDDGELRHVGGLAVLHHCRHLSLRQHAVARPTPRASAQAQD